MRIAELKIIIETLEDLGHDDVQLMIDESRDGETSYSPARAYVAKTTDQREETVMLAFCYE